MTIVVNTRLLLPDQLEGIGYFIQETFSRITTDHPEHRFIFVFDRPFDTRFIFNDNIRAVVMGPPARHPILWKWWYDVRLPALLRKYRADVFVSPDGFCSLRTRVPQCLVTHDLAFLHLPGFIPRLHYLFQKRYIPKYLKIAKRIATVSQFSKNDIVQQYAVSPGKIEVVYSGVKSIFQPGTPEEALAIKERYTDGKEFFLYTGAIHPRKNLITLLKAFSIFKKRFQSNMKLVLAGRLAWKYDSFLKDMNSYKYRQDVVMTGYIDEKELPPLMAAAYGLVYPSLLEGFGVPVLEAMRSGVPVITSVDSSMQEIAGDAAIFANPNDPKDLAEKMMWLYKDESGRRLLIEKGRERAVAFSWDRTAKLLWETILAAANKE